MLEPTEWNSISYEIVYVPLSKSTHSGKAKWMNEENKGLMAFVNNRSVHIFSDSQYRLKFDHLVLNFDDDIGNIALHQEGTIIAISFVNKQLMLIDLNSDSTFPHSVVFKMNISKKTTVIIWNDWNQLLIADKFGDVTLVEFTFDTFQSPLRVTCSRKQTPMGHYSIITDMVLVNTALLQNSNRFIITSDKDEKIRVSKWPQAYDIVSFCLAHTKYVSKILSIQSENLDCLISSGGDGKLILWDYIQGKVLFQILLYDTIQFTSIQTKLNLLCNFNELVVNSMVFLHQLEILAFSLEYCDAVHFLKIKKVQQQVEIEYMGYFTLPLIVISLQKDNNERLWVAGIPIETNTRIIVADILVHEGKVSLSTNDLAMKTIGEWEGFEKVDSESVQKLWKMLLKQQFSKNTICAK